MEYFAFWIVCGCFAGIVASQRGANGGLWLALGFLFGPLAFAASFVAPTGRTCPHCRSWIHPEATTCPRCQAGLEQDARTFRQLKARRAENTRAVLSRIGIGVGVVGVACALLAIGDAVWMHWKAVHHVHEIGGCDLRADVVVNAEQRDTLLVTNRNLGDWTNVEIAIEGVHTTEAGSGSSGRYVRSVSEAVRSFGTVGYSLSEFRRKDGSPWMPRAMKVSQVGIEGHLFERACRVDLTLADAASGAAPPQRGLSQEPALLKPESIILDATGPRGDEVTYPFAFAHGQTALQCVPPSGSIFSIGTTRVRCKSAAESGGGADLAFTVTVLGAAAQAGALRTLMMGDPAFESQVADLEGAISGGRTTAACASLDRLISLVNDRGATGMLAVGRFHLVETKAVLDAVTRLKTVLVCP